MTLFDLRAQRRRDASVGDLARSLAQTTSWTSPKKIEDQLEDGPFVREDDELLIVGLYDSRGEPTWADSRWVQFCLLRTHEVGWLPNQWVDRLT